MAQLSGRKSYGSARSGGVGKAFGKAGMFQVTTGRRHGGTGLGIKTVSGGLGVMYPEPPSDFPGTLPEWAIYWALTEVLRLKEDQDFQYLPRLAQSTGNVKGLQVDFFFPDLNLAVDIQGEHWHYGMGSAKQEADRESRLRVESVGVTYVAIDESDALRDPVYYVKEARQFRDHSLVGRGAL